MQRLQASLIALDERIDALERGLVANQNQLRGQAHKHAEALKVSRAREANAMALAQKVAARLDHAISHVEQILRD